MLSNLPAGFWGRMAFAPVKMIFYVTLSNRMKMVADNPIGVVGRARVEAMVDKINAGLPKKYLTHGLIGALFFVLIYFFFSYIGSGLHAGLNPIDVDVFPLENLPDKPLFNQLVFVVYLSGLAGVLSSFILVFSGLVLLITPRNPIGFSYEISFSHYVIFRYIKAKDIWGSEKAAPETIQPKKGDYYAPPKIEMPEPPPVEPVLSPEEKIINKYKSGLFSEERFAKKERKKIKISKPAKEKEIDAEVQRHDEWAIWFWESKYFYHFPAHEILAENEHRFKIIAKINADILRYYLKKSDGILFYHHLEWMVKNKEKKFTEISQRILDDYRNEQEKRISPVEEEINSGRTEYNKKYGKGDEWDHKDPFQQWLHADD